MARFKEDAKQLQRITNNEHVKDLTAILLSYYLDIEELQEALLARAIQPLSLATEERKYT